MKHLKVVLEIAAYAVAGLLFGCIFFRQVISSHFDLLWGDVGDARFNGVILEHWWQVLQGNAHWLSPPFFFPIQGVLGYSDAGFLNVFPYIALRFMGADPFTSYQIVLFILVTLGWIGTILFLRYCLKVGIFPTILGTVLFVFPNSIAFLPSHTQLLTIYFIPYLAIGIYVSLQNFARVTLMGTVAGIFVAIIIPAIFYTSGYVGWFSIFFIILLSGVCYAWGLLHSGGKTIYQHILCKWENWQRILPYCTLSVICFIPYLLTYVPVFRLFGPRSHHEIASTLPSFIDYVNVGPSNWVWGRVLDATVGGLGSRPMSLELTKGVPCCLLLVFLACLVYFIRKIRHYQLTVTPYGTSRIVAHGNEVNHDEKLAMLAAGLGVAVLLAWLLMLKIHHYSLWWLVVKFIPGAGCIRAVYRFQHVLAFPLAIVIAIGMHLSIKYATGHIRSYVKRSVYIIILSFFCLFLVGEQFNIGSLANYSKQQQLKMLAGIHHPPPQAKVFALLPVEGLKKLPYEAQIDAMIIAQKYGLRTINGYSGQFPPGWFMIYDFDKPEYIFALGRWIQHYNLENDQLYLLDEKTGSWLTAKTLLERGDFVIMNGPLGKKDFALELSAEKIPTQWQKNELRQCAIRVKNNGNIPLSSVGSYFNDPGKYAIRLSYRWVEKGSSVQFLDGFDNRTELPGAVKPNAEITMNMDIQAPPEPGKYFLEIEAVQELVAWFKDKGCPGVRIKVDVK